MIAQIQEDGDNLKLVIITVMKKMDFRAAPGQKTILVKEHKMKKIDLLIKEEIKRFFSEKNIIKEDDMIEKGIKNFFQKMRDKDKQNKLKEIDPNLLKTFDKADDRAKELSAGDKMLKDDPLIRKALESISAKLKASREDW